MSLFEKGNKKVWMQNADVVHHKYFDSDKVRKKVWMKIRETKKIQGDFDQRCGQIQNNSNDENSNDLSR